MSSSEAIGPWGDGLKKKMMTDGSEGEGTGSGAAIIACFLRPNSRSEKRHLAKGLMPRKSETTLMVCDGNSLVRLTQGSMTLALYLIL